MSLIFIFFSIFFYILYFIFQPLSGMPSPNFSSKRSRGPDPVENMTLLTPLVKRRYELIQILTMIKNIKVKSQFAFKNQLKSGFSSTIDRQYMLDMFPGTGPTTWSHKSSHKTIGISAKRDLKLISILLGTWMIGSWVPWSAFFLYFKDIQWKRNNRIEWFGRVGTKGSSLLRGFILCHRMVVQPLSL